VLRLCKSLLNVLLVVNRTLDLGTMLGSGTLQQFAQLFHCEWPKSGFASLVFHWVIVCVEC